MRADFTQIPLPGTQLSLAEVYRLIHYKTVFKLGYADVDRHLSDDERELVQAVAIWEAQRRGAESTARLWSVTAPGVEPEVVCAMALTTFCKSAYLLKHCNAGEEPLDFLATKMGWLPADFWAAERKKEAFSNMIYINLHVVGLTWDDEGALAPTLPQLRLLIVEMEDRLSQAITAASAVPNGTWTVDSTFGASTACKSFSVGGLTAHAHDFQWIPIPTTRYSMNMITVDRSTTPPQPCAHRVSDEARKREPVQHPTELDRPLPTFAALLSPAIAVAKLVFLSYKRNINWTDDFKNTYLAAAIYFLRLLVSVTSGKKFAEMIATRPTTSGLPPLEGHVEVGVNFHANHERHNRVFPSLGSDGSNAASSEVARAPSRRRVASERSDNDWQRPAGYEGRPPSAERPRHEELLKAALKRYEGSVAALNQKLDAAFDDGKKVDLFTLLCDWPAVHDAVGEDEAKGLRHAQQAKAAPCATGQGQRLQHSRRVGVPGLPASHVREEKRRERRGEDADTM